MQGEGRSQVGETQHGQDTYVVGLGIGKQYRHGVATNHVLEGGEGGVGGVWRGGGGGGSGWDTPPPRVSGKKLGKIFFFLPKMAMAPKKTKICGTSSPAKECLRWGLNQLPVNLQRTVLPLTYHTELLTSCIPRFIA